MVSSCVVNLDHSTVALQHGRDEKPRKQFTSAQFLAVKMVCFGFVSASRITENVYPEMDMRRTNHESEDTFFDANVHTYQISSIQSFRPFYFILSHFVYLIGDKLLFLLLLDI